VCSAYTTDSHIQTYILPSLSYDFHWMAYEDGSCQWHDIVKNGFSEHENNFKINRHNLQILQPIDDDGNLRCGSTEGSQFPRIDYSKGFPDWWHLSHTEVTVPSEHTQEGKQYDAEVQLEHFYSVDFERKMAVVSIFLQADPARERWDFLDKLICQWREVEEKTRDECGLESVPPYPGCRNPTRGGGETELPHVDLYPFIDCDSVENSARMCKSTSCCEAERSLGEYCQDHVYDLYGDEVVGSVCWWCCPGKILGPPRTRSPTMTPSPTVSSMPTSGNITYYSAPSASALPAQAPYVAETNVVSPMAPTNWMDSLPTAITTSGISYNSAPSGPSSPAQPSSVADTSNSSPSTPPVSAPGPSVDCSDYEGHKDVNLDRICRDGGCCDSVRSDSEDCHIAYKFFGDSMASVCSDCCNPSKQMAPAPPPHPTYPPIDCTGVDRPNRICEARSCCDAEKSDSNFCEDVYETYEDTMGSVCWYCCSEPKEVDPSVLARRLSSMNDEFQIDEEALDANKNLEEVRNDILLPHGLWASQLVMDPINFEVTPNLEEKYLEGISAYATQQEEVKKKQREDSSSRRTLQSGVPGDNYINTPYSPYQWMREVKTEYYYRYTGGQMVPPCFETVHYRIMKDPITIHPDQLAELERLLAWRIAPKGSENNECERDTAGRERPGSNGEQVDLNRPLQSYSNRHKKVFCECKDWDSYFLEDQAWCELDALVRTYEHPYNFYSDGF
jgi:Eukaryotic-type carbonic anhydrase